MRLPPDRECEHEGMTSRESSELLFGGAWEPFTETTWFIEAPFESVIDAVQAWRTGLGQVRLERLSGELGALIENLEPWAMPSWKELVVAAGNGWTALFSQGSDVATFEAMGRALGCRSVRTAHSPNVVRDGRVVRYGDTAFWLTDGSRTDLGPLCIVRTVQASNQDGWVWHLGGELQPFEEPELYRRRIVRDRFTIAALNRYCAALGIDRADPAFYGPDALLLEQDATNWPHPPRTMQSSQWRAEHV